MTSPRLPPVLALSVVLVTTLLCASARAQAPAGGDAAETARLSAFSAADRAALAPLLARGPVALVEFTDGDALPALLLAAEVAAPAASVAAIVGQPEAYPRFMGGPDAGGGTGRHPGPAPSDRHLAPKHILRSPQNTRSNYAVDTDA